MRLHDGLPAQVDEPRPVAIRQVQHNELSIVADLDYEAFSPYGTAENPETFVSRFKAFPSGFVVLTEGDEIAGYGCSEKWLAEREPGLDENPLETHQPDGKIFRITGMAVRIRHRAKGYGLAILDSLIQIAKREQCTKIVLETTDAQRLYLKRGFKTVRSRNERGVALDIMSLDVESNVWRDLMNEYSRNYQIRWSDLDANGHVNYSAYINAAADLRYHFFSERNFPPEKFVELGIGPVYTAIHARFLREVRMGETVTITYALAGLSPQGGRWKVQHDILRSNGKKAVSLEIEGAILNLTTRKLAFPTPELMQTFQLIPRAKDFGVLSEMPRRK